ncbi:hypothetical protein G1C96_0308 [Bifidobacterium sp. DSM 109958]|uniref:Uncharacterized protein n=1 Tax=Bifidobacterium moraviense TaxID=2675323 RepID=A0A7Y0F0G1_9BIFI|nr:hypothetical protein [Bifidobacterium sp. DSM 109958]NMM99730.1 hypothetical protein [Bifidobacterium sp. DSM 109958]
MSDMDMQQVTVGGIDVAIPHAFSRLNRMPDDPPDMTAYGAETPQATCVMFLQPIPADHAMPFGNEQAVADGIHRSLGDDQGLIEVAGGATDAGRNVIWSIVKTVSQTEGAQYALTLHLDCGGFALQAQAFASEAGATGIREAQVYEFARQHGWIDDQGRGWSRDPYDAEYRRGILMNLSEDSQFDDAFPDHPLSVVRSLASAIVGCN